MRFDSSIDVGVFALVGSAFLGILPAFERASAIRAATVVCLGGVFYVATVQAAGRRGRWRRLALAAVVLGAMAAAYFLLQYRFIVTEPKVQVTDAIGRSLSGPWPRLGAWTPFPNSLATLLEGLVPLAVGLALGRGSRRVRTTAAVCASVMSLAVVVAASRGAWLALGVAAVAWLIAAAPARVRTMAALGALVAIVGSGAWVAVRSPAGEPWWFSLGALFDRPDRLDVYRHTLTLLGDVPFTGIGAGDQFALAMSRYALLIEVPFLTYSHNLVLDLWLEQGLLGLLAWLVLGAAVVVSAVAGERASMGLGFRGAWVGVVAIYVHGLTDARQSVDGWTWMPLFALAALTASRTRRFRVRQGSVSRWIPPVVAGATAATVLAASQPVGAAWQANLGAVAQARAELSPTLDATARDELLGGARAHFARALALDPNQPAALRRLGRMAISEGRYAEGAGQLALAWASDPANGTTRKAYGLALVWVGDVGRASDVLAAVPGIVEELNTWAWWRRSRNEPALAMAAAETSLLLHPKQPAVRALLSEMTEAKTADEMKEVSSNQDFGAQLVGSMGGPAHGPVNRAIGAGVRTP